MSRTGSSERIARHVEKTRHAWKLTHNINSQEVRILAGKNIWGERRVLEVLEVLEALEIQQRRPMMNLDAGLLLVWSGPPFVHPMSRSHETSNKEDP